ncbi:MAG TPA: hypothetical protein VFY48_07490 [Solirubrobacterales bacterium]|nr:hypothetical protein [Solirubrobacterales bacterium]
MTSARQILRYSIPGSIYLIHLVLCYLIYQRIRGIPLIDAVPPIRDTVGGLLAILATIPIGFVIYQAYYFLYEPIVRPWPLRWRGRLVRNDRGGEILESLDPGHIAELEEIFACKVRLGKRHTVVPNDGSLIGKAMHRSGVQEIAGPFAELPPASKEQRRAYEDLWYTNWDVLRAAVEIAGSSQTGEQVKAEYTNLSDIYHSLGAAKTAVVAALTTLLLLVVVAHPLRFADSLPRSFFGIVAVLALSVGIYLVLHIARGRTWRSAAAAMKLGLRWFHREQQKPRPEQPA